MLINPFRLLIVITYLSFSLIGCDSSKPETIYPFTYQGETEGTTFHIKASYLSKTLTQQQLQQQIKQVLDKIDGQMSTYKPDSELSKFNQSQSSEWHPISPELFTVIQQAQIISDSSQGAFDITIGGLVNLWGFGPEPLKFTTPTEADIQQRLSKIGYQQLHLQSQPLAIQKTQPDLYVDLSAIAKGYAVDQVGLTLEHAGIQDYMVEIGGEVRVKGLNVEHQPWRIAIEKPIPNKILVERVIPLSNISMATSGDYRNFFEIKGVRFSHTIDPRSGKPITHRLASISVLHRTTMEADGWATALNVLGPEAGFQLAEKLKIAALFIVKTDHGFEEKPTTTFLNLIR
ncbi:MAG: hypothetical protein RL637_395 [Pseudomonadota bacterium]|jgi:thiamine biosynthesis lipoprotein